MRDSIACKISDKGVVKTFEVNYKRVKERKRGCHESLSVHIKVFVRELIACEISDKGVIKTFEANYRRVKKRKTEYVLKR